MEYHVSGHTAWTSWSRYGGHLLPGTGPAVALTHGRIYLAAVGTDHAIWVKHHSPSGWRPWHSLGGHTTATPALAAPADGVVVAFARGTAGTASYNQFHGQTAGVTAGWHSIGGTLTSGPTAIPNQAESPAPATSVFALGPDHQPWVDTGTWPALTGWQQVQIGP